MHLDEPPASAEALRAQIVRAHSVRLHCTLILIACFGTGFLATRALLWAGMDTMWTRYTLALLVAYGVFLLGVRAWLHYAGFDVPVLPRKRERREANADGGSFDLPVGSSGGSWKGPGEVFRGGGGRSGGGGASAGWEGSVASQAKSPAWFTGSSGGGGGGSSGSVDLDDGLVLVALIAVAVAVSGAVLYLIWAAPTILADAAFAALLSAGLVRSTRKLATSDWISSVVGNTWIPFAVVALLAIGFALVAQHAYPDARTVGDVIRHLRH